jgi:hypothetical protein
MIEDMLLPYLQVLQFSLGAIWFSIVVYEARSKPKAIAAFFVLLTLIWSDFQALSQIVDLTEVGSNILLIAGLLLAFAP